MNIVEAWAYAWISSILKLTFANNQLKLIQQGYQGNEKHIPNKTT